MNNMKRIIFTDLDGTLLDYNKNYSYRPAIPALRLLRRKKIPLVICTSKTRAEVEYYIKKWKLKDPFICENGGAIFIRRNYFNFKYDLKKKIKQYNVIEFGTEYKKIIEVLGRVKKKVKGEGKIIGYSDMSIKQLRKETGLSKLMARLAKIREYDESFKIVGSKKTVNKIKGLVKKYGLNFIKAGKFYHVLGDSDKGKAVKKLISLYKRQYGRIETIGLGDDENDAPMFEEVDKVYLVRGRDGKYHISKKQKVKLEKVDGIGPVGWKKAIMKIFAK